MLHFPSDEEHTNTTSDDTVSDDDADYSEVPATHHLSIFLTRTSVIAFLLIIGALGAAVCIISKLSIWLFVVSVSIFCYAIFSLNNLLKSRVENIDDGDSSDDSDDEDGDGLDDEHED